MELSRLKSASLYTRVISAVIALTFVFGLFYFFQINGLRILCLIAVIIGTLELIKILFRPEDSFRIKALFYVLTVLIFIVSVVKAELATVIFAFCSVFYISAALFLHKRFEDLASFSEFSSKSILGFMYIGLLPSYACKLLDLNHGLNWFITLLAVVFAGDTMAYVFGLLWGKRKLMPQISPKKTIEGSMGGLLGSIIAAIICSQFLPDMPIFYVALLGSFTGAIGQMGDLFESMLKRVADVKDSGKLMPGHGGILDRIDGVLFASPVLYLGAILVEKISL